MKYLLTVYRECPDKGSAIPNYQTHTSFNSLQEAMAALSDQLWAENKFMKVYPDGAENQNGFDNKSYDIVAEINGDGTISRYQFNIEDLRGTRKPVYDDAGRLVGYKWRQNLQPTTVYISAAFIEAEASALRYARELDFEGNKESAAAMRKALAT